MLVHESAIKDDEDQHQWTKGSEGVQRNTGLNVTSSADARQRQDQLLTGGDLEPRLVCQVAGPQARLERGYCRAQTPVNCKMKRRQEAGSVGELRCL